LELAISKMTKGFVQMLDLEGWEGGEEKVRKGRGFT